MRALRDLTQGSPAQRPSQTDDPFSVMFDGSRDHNTSRSVAFSVGIGLCRGAAAANEEAEIGFQLAEMQEPELRAWRFARRLKRCHILTLAFKDCTLGS
jgi:hypothetical protein